MIDFLMAVGLPFMSMGASNLFNLPAAQSEIVLAWDLPNDPSVTSIELRAGQSSDNFTVTNDFPVTNTTTFNLPPLSKPFVFKVFCVSSNGAFSPPSNEAYYNVPTNGLVWLDSTNAHFGFVGGSNHGVNLQNSTNLVDWPELYTNFFGSNTLVDIKRPILGREFFRLFRE